MGCETKSFRYTGTKRKRSLAGQVEKILSESGGAIRGADPDSRLSNKTLRNMHDHKAMPEEQPRLRN